MSEDPSPRAGVLCAGTILVDVAKVIDGYPALDHLTTIERIWLSTGGPALNMAVDLSMLGAPFPLGVLGAVGDDAHAAFILAECARLGINTDGVATLPGAATSFTDVMVEKDGGRRTMFHHPGANALFDASTAGLETSTARILHTGAPGIHPVMDSRRPGGGNGWSALLQRAQAAGLHTNMELVSISPDRTAATALPCLPHLDSIVINELEAGALTGIDASVPTADGPVDWPGLEAMAVGLIERGVCVLAVVHFPAGCVAAAPGGRTWRQGSVRLPRDQVRSTTGAGDAFAAGVILGLHQGWPVERCLRLAVASAAACVRSPRTSDGIMPAQACLAEADQAGYRPVVNPLRLDPGQVRLGGRRRDGCGQHGYEVPGPAVQVLVGGPVLTGHLGVQRTTRPARGVELDPGGVDVEFHRDPGTVGSQGPGQVDGDRRHARGVDQVPGRVLAKRAAGHVRAAAQGRAPHAPVGGRGGGLTPLYQRLQVLPDAVEARGGRALAPDRDPGPARAVDDQAGETGAQRADHMALLLVAARARGQLEAAIERGEQLLSFGADHDGPGPHHAGRRRTRVQAAVVQDVPDRTGEDGHRHRRAVRGPHPGHGHPRGRRRGGRSGAPRRGNPGHRRGTVPPGRMGRGPGPGRSRTAGGDRNRGGQQTGQREQVLRAADMHAVP
jgi:sugar/nucleoside kinase (ribokinase family)